MAWAGYEGEPETPKQMDKKKARGESSIQPAASPANPTLDPNPNPIPILLTLPQPQPYRKSTPTLAHTLARTPKPNPERNPGP